MKNLTPNRLLHYAFLLIVWLGLAACNPPYEIVEPISGSVHTAPPAEYKIRYQTLPNPFPHITLNGIRVESFFTLGATEAVAQGADLAPFLVQGKNTLQINPAQGPSIDFIYDTTGPNVVVLNADSNNPNTINGLLVDTAGAKSLFVNGTSTTIAADGSFTAKVPAADVYTFDVVDKMDHVSQTQYARLGLTNNPTLGIRVNQSGINFAMATIVNVLNGLDFNSMVGGTKIYDTTWKGPSGETYGADGTLDSLSISASAFNLALGENGNATFSGTITTAHATLTLRLHNGLLPPTVIQIGADIGPLDLSGKVNMQVVNHMPVITLSDFSFNVGAIVLDNTPSVFNAIISPVTSGLLNLLNTQISGLISQTLSSQLPGLLSQLILDSYTVSLYGLDMSAVMQLENLTTGNGSLLVTMSGGVTPAAKSVNPLVAQPLGTLYTPDALPEPTAGVGDFSLNINTNFINQILASAHSVGLTQVNTVTTTSTGAKTNQFGLPHDDSLGGNGDSRTLIEMQTAPQIQVASVDGKLATKLNLYGLKVVLQRKINGSWSTAYSARMNVIADVKLSVGANNNLEVRVASVPTINITGVAVGNGPELPGTLNDEINHFAQLSVGYVLQQLTQPLASLKLPSLACMSLTINQLNTFGANNTHLGMAGTLTKTSNACDNAVGTPPKVAYSRGVGTTMICDATEEYDAGLCYQPCQAGYDGVGPVCWAQNASYGRGVGTAATPACASNEDMDAGLCYPKCQTGYHGVGPVCWNDLPQSYGRGVGTIPNLIPYGCPSGKEMDAGLCYVPCNSGYHGVGPVCWLDQASYGRGVGTVPPLTCASGQELDAGLCYPVCNTGYHGVGPVCWTDNALSYGRGVGVPVHTCPAGKEADAGLCYDQCAAGFSGSGPICWPQK